MWSRTRILSRRLLPALLAVAAALAGTLPGETAALPASTTQVLALGQNPVALAVDRRDGLVCVVVQGPQDVFGRYSGNGLVRIVALSSGRIVHSATVGAEPVAAAVDERSGHVFIANYADRSVSVLDLRHGWAMHTVTVGVAPRSLAVDERRGRVLVVDDGLVNSMGTRIGNPSVSVLNAASGKLLHIVAASFGSYPTIGGIDERAGHAFVLDTSGVVTMLDTASGKTLGSAAVGALYNIAVAGPNSLMAVDSAAGHAFIANSVSSGLTMLDTRTDKVLRAIALRAPVSTLAADGRGHVVALDTHNTVSVLDGRSGRITHTVAALPASGRGGAVSALTMVVDGQGRRAFVVTAETGASGRQRYSVYGVNLAGGRGSDLRRVSIPGDSIGGAAWATDGRLLVMSTRVQAPATQVSLLGAGWLSIIS